jgi:serine/threonine-protein kinase
MTPATHAQMRVLFDFVVDQPRAIGEQLLARECFGQPGLLAELQGLLDADRQLQDKTFRPFVRLANVTAAPAPALSGQRVGPYEIKEVLGHGGMGLVYRAERVDGDESQQVAIKFVRRELLDEHTRRRFLAERRFLAALDHPNIARLLDAAELDDGSPYFVMEYVDGVPLTDHCKRAGLDVRARVALFRKVCAAVAQAHRNGVVHRDLKPGNILVDASGVPKLLDFGIAKPLAAVDATAAVLTATAQRYFSPLYAAPEQLRGTAVGVGCDVYALGLLLYELLAGCRPFDFRGLSAGEIEHMITTLPPTPPSKVAARSETARSSQRQLRGDLDDIVLQCLRKAPGERYGSVAELDADLARHLAGVRVTARGRHAWYRARECARRHRVAVMASALMIAAFGAGALTSDRQWRASTAGSTSASDTADSLHASEAPKQVKER